MQSKRYHLIFDITACQYDDNEERLKTFVVDTIAAIGMKVLHGPIVCEGVPENPGLSCLAVLDFSHISIHTFTRHHEIQVDIFSCKEYDRQLVRKKCLQYFATPESTIRAKEVWWG
jgi:S-adenosylmethionine/arginine decarboxylase-like enzyme